MPAPRMLQSWSANTLNGRCARKFDRTYDRTLTGKINGSDRRRTRAGTRVEQRIDRSLLRRALAGTWSRQELARSVPSRFALVLRVVIEDARGHRRYRHRSRHERLSRRPPCGQSDVREPPVIGLQALLRVGVARTSSTRRSYA